jgi:EmrB/QacA subfamily drug resistance transporter
VIRLPAREGAEVLLSYRSARGRWVLAATVLGSGMASLDATVVGIALPRIGKDFYSGVSSLQWVVTAYTLTLAAFLLLGGTLGDRYGRRRVFVIGVVWFAVASAGCAAAPTASMLIAARALQGVGAALLTPGSLAILQSSFEPSDRSRAIGAWSGLAALATATGPIVGGYLLSVGSWRWVFLLNLPLACAVLEVTRRHVPESTDRSAVGRIDVPGAVLAVLALSTLTYGLIEAPGAGWGSASVVGCLAVGAVAAVAFVVTERRSAAPMLPPSMFLARQFAATNAVTFLVYGALGGALFLLPVALQQVAGYSPLDAGLTLIPVTVLMLTLSAASGRLATRLGPRLQMAVGPLVAGVGLTLLVRLTSDHTYLTGVLPGVLVLGAGLVITVAPLTSTAMSSAPGEHAGLASAVNNDVARAAGLFAVAVLPVVSGLTGDAYLHPAVFAHGFRIASVIAGVMCMLGAIVAALTITNTGDVGVSVGVEHHPLSQTCVGATAPPLTAAATAPPLTAAALE